MIITIDTDEKTVSAKGYLKGVESAMGSFSLDCNLATVGFTIKTFDTHEYGSFRLKDKTKIENIKGETTLIYSNER